MRRNTRMAPGRPIGHRGALAVLALASCSTVRPAARPGAPAPSPPHDDTQPVEVDAAEYRRALAQAGPARVAIHVGEGGHSSVVLGCRVFDIDGRSYLDSACDNATHVVVAAEFEEAKVMVRARSLADASPCFDPLAIMEVTDAKVSYVICDRALAPLGLSGGIDRFCSKHQRPGLQCDDATRGIVSLRISPSTIRKRPWFCQGTGPVHGWIDAKITQYSKKPPLYFVEWEVSGDESCGRRRTGSHRIEAGLREVIDKGYPGDYCDDISSKAGKQDALDLLQQVHGEFWRLVASEHPGPPSSFARCVTHPEDC